jgi:16S rRNA (cytidine1402-2'-O)-methyltransferase
MQNGTLYVVSTPIGNLEDLSFRAVEVLRGVDLIASEDTRRSRPLLDHYGIKGKLIAYHDHNEGQAGERLLRQLAEGASIALVSDAGTPLISDPGYSLVSRCQATGIRVVPVPGASALLAALAVAGLPTDRFTFAGFPPRTNAKRRALFETLAGDSGTLVLYESSHRIVESLGDACELFGCDREAALGRELTKIHETILRGTLAQILEQVQADANQRKGEFVVMIGGAGADSGEISPETRRLLGILLEELPVKQAAGLAARISGEKKNRLYQYALRLNR